MALNKSLIPKDAKRIPLRPVALGEVTGHSHQLTCDGGEAVLEQLVEMYEAKGPDGETHLFVRVNAAADTETEVRIEHQEHKSHTVAPGEYRVTIQSEVTDWGKQPVRD